jgi:hypothetical protein
VTSAGLPGFNPRKFPRVGATVGVAWDAGAGSLQVAVDGANLFPLFPDGLRPGLSVGAGLFPAMSGSGGCRVGFNLGGRPFRHPPAGGFLPCAEAAAATAAAPAWPPGQVLCSVSLGSLRVASRFCTRASIRVGASGTVLGELQPSLPAPFVPSMAALARPRIPRGGKVALGRAQQVKVQRAT